MSEPESMQFDRAEYAEAPPPTACGSCKAPLMSAYFELNGTVLCPDCAETAREEFTSGSRIGRLARAGGAGLVAAILGATLYYAVAALTGYAFGLIAIVVGFAVGAAVRWGASGHGGWPYQALAMALTYFAIVSMYVPDLIEVIQKAPVEQASATPATDGSTPPPAAAAQSSGGPAQEASTAHAVAEPVSAGQAFVAVLVLVALVAALPFLGGLQNIMGIVIIGIGLYEAWKLTRRVPFDISGPHPVRAAPAPSA